MDKKIRLGFIGCGGIARYHFNHLKNVPRAELVALNDPSDASIDVFRTNCPGTEKLPVYKDYRDMIAREKLDAVYIMSPHTPHCQQILDCLDAGLHVLTEKPMVCTIQDAEAVIQKGRETGKVFMISYQRHFDPQFRYMREQIAEGKLGEVQFVQALQSQEWMRATANTWRQEKAQSGGGQINDSGSHLVDIIMWVTGLTVSEVFAKMEYFDREVDINSTLSMTFTNGALGSMSVIGNAPRWYEDHTIVGSKGAFYLRQGLGLIHQDEHGNPIDVKLPEYKNTPDSNFIACIFGEEEPQVPPICGLRTIEVTEAAWKSAEAGKPVKVPTSTVVPA